MPRQRNKRGLSVALTPSNGQWVGFVTVGRRSDGSPDRRKRAAAMCARCKVTPTVGCDCYEVCANKIRELEDQVAARTVAKAGRAETLGQYLEGWLAGVEGNLEYKTFVSYRGCVAKLLPLLGGVEVPALEPTEITLALQRVGRDVSANEAHKVWRVLRSALSDYERRYPAVRNMAKLAKPPKLDPKEITPFSVDEAKRIIAAIADRRSRVRWYLAIACGLRQGEALGLEWSDVDFDEGTLTVRSKQYRRTWQHGCADPASCGTHRTKPCRPDCTRHTRACPPLCPADCVRHASTCPQRRGGGLVKGLPKNRKRRSFVVPGAVLDALREHRRTQESERELAGSKWEDHGRVFTQPTGRPIDARRDMGDWKDILTDAGVRDARVHDARHTAATLYRLLKVDTRVSMGLFGWSTSSMAERYEHVTGDMTADAAQRMNDLLFPPVAPHTDPVPDGPRSATGTATGEGAKILQFRPRSA